MDLHDLLAETVDGLPPMPDRAPAAAEILRRRRARGRRGLLASVCVLAIGASTVTLAAPWRQTAPASTKVHMSGAASPSPKPERPAAPAKPTPFERDALAALQSLWPVAGTKLSWDPPQGFPGDWPASQPTTPGVTFSVGGDYQAMTLFPQRWASVDPGDGETMNRCGNPPLSFPTLDFRCASTTLSGGRIALVLRGRQSAGAPAYTQVYLWQGNDTFVLMLDGTVAQHITDQQFFALARSAAYGALFAEGERDGLFAADEINGVGGGSAAG